MTKGKKDTGTNHDLQNAKQKTKNRATLKPFVFHKSHEDPYFCLFVTETPKENIEHGLYAYGHKPFAIFFDLNIASNNILCLVINKLCKKILYQFYRYSLFIEAVGRYDIITTSMLKY